MATSRKIRLATVHERSIADEGRRGALPWFECVNPCKRAAPLLAMRIAAHQQAVADALNAWNTPAREAIDLAGAGRKACARLQLRPTGFECALFTNTYAPKLEHLRNDVSCVPRAGQACKAHAEQCRICRLR